MDSTGCQPIPPVANCCQPRSRQHAGYTFGSSWQPVDSVGNRWNQLAAGGISYQLIPQIVNRFPRLPTAANRAAGMLPAARLAAVGNRRNRLTGGGVSWQPLELVGSGEKLYEH